jgi:DNA-binding protein
MRIENGVLVIRPADTSLRISEVAERIISGIMEAEELDIVGVSNGIYLTCASINMAKDIANVNVNEICLDYVDVPVVGKIETISCGLSKKQIIDYKKLVAEEEADMHLTTDREGQIISVGGGISLDKLLTLCLLKFSKTGKLKIIAAGRVINDAVSLSLKLTKGQISKEAIGIDLVDLYSIETKADPTKRTTAISIYLKKGCITQYSKRHTDLIRKIKG